MSSNRRRSRRGPSSENKPNTTPPAPVLSAAYLECSSSKNDLVRRLRKVVEALSDEDLEVNSPEHPGLDGLTAALVNPKFLQHKDKEVRLHTVLACMETFYLYAPEAPWDVDEILLVFEQIIKQLSNLSHCTVARMPNYRNYFRLLEQLATVKVAVVLVELYHQGNTAALETLAELVKTLLEAMHRDHQSEIMGHAVAAITASIEEYEPSAAYSNVPVPLLDEILVVLANGPTTQEIVASATSKKVQTVQVPSPAYILASHVLRRCEDRLSSPIARLLNALLNGGGNKLAALTRLHSDQVWLIVYELHRVCPGVLTEVIGNVAGLLVCEDIEQRLRVCRLLGRLFYSQSSDIASRFNLCFRQWLNRSSDCDTGIRTLMAKCLVQILKNKPNLASDIEGSLLRLLADPDVDIRSVVVHNLCDLVSMKPENVSPALLVGVSERVQSKNKKERRDAVTGLSKVYQLHYMRPKLALIDADDDCGIDTILDVLADEDDLAEERFGWIPETVAKCLYYNDASDSDMRSRVIQIIDDVLVPKSMSVLARSAGLAIVLRGMEGSERWMEVKLSERESLQTKLAEYIEKRPRKKETPEEIAQFKLAFAVLQEISRFMPAAPSQTLQKLHQHKDKHVFRLLGSIASCNHSEAALSRATSDVSKRCSSFADDGLAWMKTLVRRVGMGSLFNGGTVKQSAELALESFNEGAYGSSLSFLQAVSLSSKCMPCLGSVDGDVSMFEALVTLFEKSSSESKSNTTKLKGSKKQEVASIVSSVSAILASIAPSVASASESALSSKDYKALQSALMKICVEGDDAIMARNAVLVLGSFCKATTSTDKTFAPLLKELTAPHRLSISNAGASLHTILAALAALAECASAQFCAEKRAGKAVQFALKLLLKNEIPAQQHNQHISSKNNKSKAKEVSHNHNAASSIRVSAIQLAVAYTRASLKFRQKRTKAQDGGNNDNDMAAILLDSDQIESTFEILTDILNNNDNEGELSSDAKVKVKRAATIGLLQLCDSSLPLQKYLTSACYVSLSRALLSTEIRDASVIMEFNAMTRASKPYSNAPSLRLLAMTVSLQDDCSSVKNAVTDCVHQLRATCELLQSQNPTLFDSKYKVKLMPEYALPYSLYLLAHVHAPVVDSSDADNCGNDNVYEADATDVESSSSNKKLTMRIQKQLRMILDPLVQSPTGEADNISFLLRIMEMIGHSYSIRCCSAADKTTTATKSNNRRLNDTLKRVCRVGRDMLLKGVKHDSQLTAYPHHIQLPANLFYKVVVSSNNKPSSRHGNGHHSPVVTPSISPKMTGVGGGKDDDVIVGESSSKARVSFSSDLRHRSHSPGRHNDENENTEGNVMDDRDVVVDDQPGGGGDEFDFEMDDAAGDDNEVKGVGDSPSNDDEKRPASNQILSQLSTSTPASRSSQPRTPLSAISTAQSEISALTPPSTKKAARSAKKVAVMIHKPQSSQSSASKSSTRSRRSSASKRKSPVDIDEFDFDNEDVDLETSKRKKSKGGSSKKKTRSVSKRSGSSDMKEKSSVRRKSVRGLGQNSSESSEKTKNGKSRSARSDGADGNVGSGSIRGVPRRSASVKASSRLRQR